VKKHKVFVNLENLSQYPITDILEGWFFRVNEISQGYYRVEGIDRFGHSISRDGIEPDQLFTAIKADIIEKFTVENT
jgi:hypothetical protein